MRPTARVGQRFTFQEDARLLLLDPCRRFSFQESHEQGMVQALIRVEMSILQRASYQDLRGCLAVLKEWF